MKDGRTLPRRMQVIDDENLINELMCQVGELEGYEVRSFTRALDFLAQEDAEMPDLLLVDIFMPEVDGFELLKQLEYRKVVPAIVIMSGKDPAFLSAASIIFTDSKLRFMGQIAKPCSVAEIQDVISMERVFADRSNVVSDDASSLENRSSQSNPGQLSRKPQSNSCC